MHPNPLQILHDSKPAGLNSRLQIIFMKTLKTRTDAVASNKQSSDRGATRGSCACHPWNRRSLACTLLTVMWCDVSAVLISRLASYRRERDTAFEISEACPLPANLTLLFHISRVKLRLNNGVNAVQPRGGLFDLLYVRIHKFVSLRTVMPSFIQFIHSIV
jgi:hypothetical protein